MTRDVIPDPASILSRWKASVGNWASAYSVTFSDTHTLSDDPLSAGAIEFEGDHIIGLIRAYSTGAMDFTIGQRDSGDILVNKDVVVRSLDQMLDTLEEFRKDIETCAGAIGS